MSNSWKKKNVCILLCGCSQACHCVYKILVPVWTEVTFCTWLPRSQLRGSAKLFSVSSGAFNWWNRPDQKNVMMHAEKCHKLSEWGEGLGSMSSSLQWQKKHLAACGPVCIITGNKGKHSWETFILHKVKKPQWWPPLNRYFVMWAVTCG